MTMGGARPGAGRKKGGRNRMTEAAVVAAEATGQTPLDYMLEVMRDTNVERRDRIDAAKAAAPYVHARLSQIDANMDGSVEVVGRVVWGGLSA